MQTKRIVGIAAGAVAAFWILACQGGTSEVAPDPDGAEDPNNDADPDEAPGGRKGKRGKRGKRKGGKGGGGGDALETECRIYAWVTDPDPKGLNVRADPNGSAEILGVLTHEEPPISVTLVDANAGWFQISRAEHFENTGGSSTEDLPQSGWVSGSLLGVSTRNYGPTSEYKLHKEPDSNSPVVADPGEATVSLVDCKGKWLKVKHDGKQGWLSPEGQCSSSVTTCP